MSEDGASSHLRVLWLIKGLGPGGAEHILVATARHADASRFRFRAAYLLDWKTTLVAPLERAGVPTSCLGVRDARDPRWLLRLRRLLREHPVDVVHVHSPLVAGLARLVILTLPHRPPVISTEHNSWASHDRWSRLVNRLTFRLDKAHIVVSATVLESLPPSLRDRAEVVVHGVEIDAIVELRGERGTVRVELGIEPTQVAICTVANLRWQKGYSDLLVAAKQVLDAGCDAVFLAVGQGPMQSELLERRDELGLRADQFRFLGYREDVTRVLSGCDVFTLASLHEGYPIAVMEAMVAGLPVVSTAAGSVPEAVRNGVEGYIVPARDPTALAAALITLVRDPELRATMASAASTRGLSFDTNHAIRRTEEIYLDVAGRPR